MQHAQKFFSRWRGRRRSRSNNGEAKKDQSVRASFVSGLLASFVGGLIALAGAYIISDRQIGAQERQTIASKQYEAFSSLYSYSLVNERVSGEEFVDAEQAHKLLRYAAVADGETLAKLARLTRTARQECGRPTEQCLEMFVRQLLLHRQAIGLTDASEADLTFLLRGPIDTLAKVRRGRNDTPVMFITPKEMDLKASDISALSLFRDSLFSEIFPPEKFVIVIQLSTVEESTSTERLNIKSLVCIANVGVSPQPAHGINPRIPTFSHTWIGRRPIDEIVEGSREECLLGAANRAVTALFEGPIDPIARGLGVQLKK